MKRKSIILLFALAGIVGVLSVLSTNMVIEHQVLKSAMPHQVRKLIFKTAEKKKEVLSNAQEIIKEDALIESSEEIEAQIDEINHVLESSNAVDKMNSGDLDDQTRKEFMDLLEARQKLLTTLVDRELKAANELLAGTK